MKTVLFNIIKVLQKVLLKLLIKCGGIISDKCFLKLRYRLEMGEVLNLKNPKKFTEKLQWLKLYNRKPEYTTMVDKYAVKKYVAERIGEEYIIPTLGIWDKPENIDFESLPDKFVLKTTHGGGSTGVVICNNKSSFNRKTAIKRLKKSIKSDIYKYYREWPYKNVPRRIIAEQYMEDCCLGELQDYKFFNSCGEYKCFKVDFDRFIEHHANYYDAEGNICILECAGALKKELSDYKFYCFNGVPTYCQVIANRSTHETIDFFDMEWNHMSFVGLNPMFGNAFKPAALPAALPLMIEIAKKLSVGIPFLRVDLYYINGKVYFGETTFYPASGFGVFTPEIWNEKLGKMIELPKKRF